ncbi:MAG: hypothetical protein HQL41_04135 [Alphaproteobacteria bacterium]|nr:hypothetical protein [Alphaproteobacteria bacterium]
MGGQPGAAMSRDRVIRMRRSPREPRRPGPVSYPTMISEAMGSAMNNIIYIVGLVVVVVVVLSFLGLR